MHELHWAEEKLIDAQAEIDRLRAENERLRKALEEIMEWTDDNSVAGMAQDALEMK